MLTEHSLRLTTPVFIIQLLFDATFTLDCSRFIGFCRNLYLISSLTHDKYLFPFKLSFYAEFQHFSGSSYLNGENFVYLDLYQHKTVLSRRLKRGFSRWIRSTHMELLLIWENSCSNFFPWPLILNFHSTFDITYFRQHLHNLISEGQTNLWAEYNDGCVQRGGIHGLLFVIYLLNNFHIFVE